MSQSMIRISAALLCTVCLVAPLHGVQAKNDKARSVISWDHQKKADVSLGVQINIGDRNIIQDYLQQRYRKNCPPGLAKKNNGCLPPGQAKKYRLGHRLANDVRIEDLPGILLSRLSAPPRGYRYGMIDQDVVLVSRQDRLIADAVSLLIGR